MKLQRITSSSRWVPEIDGLRFIAIAAVLLVHVAGQTVNRAGAQAHVLPTDAFLISHINLLGRGVQLFFVISGFILAQPFVRQHIDGGKPVGLRAFYLRRVTRLEPPYLLSIAVYLAASLLLRSHGPGQWMSALSSVFYLHNFFPHLPPVNFVTWSLEIEVEFYLLAPVIALLFRMRPDALRRCLTAALVLVLALLPTARLDAIGFLFPGQACYFLLGYLLADLRVHQRPEWSSAAWDIISVVAWPAFFLLPDFRFTRVTLCVVLCICFTASMFGPFTRRTLAWRPIAIIGGMCYSLYLLHMLILSGLSPFTRRALIFSTLVPNLALQALLLLPCILLGGTLYFMWIERPCMDPEWPRKLLALTNRGVGERQRKQA